MGHLKINPQAKDADIYLVAGWFPSFPGWAGGVRVSCPRTQLLCPTVGGAGLGVEGLSPGPSLTSSWRQKTVRPPPHLFTARWGTSPSFPPGLQKSLEKVVHIPLNLDTISRNYFFWRPTQTSENIQFMTLLKPQILGFFTFVFFFF